MPPSNSTSSPVKRPGLSRRSMSSHAVVTRAANPGDPPDAPPTNHIPHLQKPPHHRPHRAHVVGVGHRSHARNPSFGKNLNKALRLSSAHQLGADATARGHHRKKSTPVSPDVSPRGTQQIHWDGALNDGGGGDKSTSTSMKKNYSSPSLQRSSSGVLVKTSLVTDRPHSSSEKKKKKTVGFELAGSDNDEGDEGEWEDTTTQSPHSTRRSSVAQPKDSVESNTVLVDPLTFVKRPFPQSPRAASLPHSFHRQSHLPERGKGKQDAEDQESSREPGHNDVAARFFSPAHSAKAPPAMSSISATAKPSDLDGLIRNASLTNLPPTQSNARRTPSASTAGLANTPGSQTQATSSSMEGGVSRFIVNKRSDMYPSSRTDSDPNTQSSFLPHYHPQTPPSPSQTPKKPQVSPPARQPGTEPASRTQQKLWLQRTATLNTPPPDPHVSAVSPSAMDPAFMATVHSRPGAYDMGRGPMMNGGPRTGGALQGGESKHIRKAYEKTALELDVVRRFQSPTGDSFSRLSSIIGETKGAAGRPAPLCKSFRSAPALSLLRDGRQYSREEQIASSPESKQLMSRRTSDSKTPATRTRADEPITPTTEVPHDFKSQHPSNPILSTSAEASHARVTAPDEEDLEGDTHYPDEADMMIRRMWESREVAVGE